MSENKPWLDPSNAEKSTGLYEGHTIKDVIKFLRENKIGERHIGYVRKNLNTVNYDVNPLYPWPKKKPKDRFIGSWEETPTKFIAYYAKWHKGEYRVIVFSGKKKDFEIPNIHRDKISDECWKKPVGTITKRRKRKGSGSKVEPRKERKKSRFDNLIM